MKQSNKIKIKKCMAEYIRNIISNNYFCTKQNLLV